MLVRNSKETGATYPNGRAHMPGRCRSGHRCHLLLRRCRKPAPYCHGGPVGLRRGRERLGIHGGLAPCKALPIRPATPADARHRDWHAKRRPGRGSSSRALQPPNGTARSALRPLVRPDRRGCERLPPPPKELVRSVSMSDHAGRRRCCVCAGRCIIHDEFLHVFGESRQLELRCIDHVTGLVVATNDVFSQLRLALLHRSG